MDRPCAVYRAYGANNCLLYVGISYNVQSRLKSHKRSAKWHELMTSHTCEWFDNRELAEQKEAVAISREKPIYNIQSGIDRSPLHSPMVFSETEKQFNLVYKYIERINDWLKETGTKENKLGLLATANACAVARIRSGKGSVGSLRSVLKYIDTHS